MRTVLTTTTTSLALTPTNTQRSTWHSPVPYLFGGLAAMLGLIAFALLILACSYWKLSGQLQNEENGERDLENGEREGDSANKESVKVYEEKILVIMAGDDNPTFLATPACANCSSVSNGVENYSEDKDIQNHETSERSEKNMDNHVTTSEPESRENEEQQSQRQ